MRRFIQNCSCNYIWSLWLFRASCSELMKNNRSVTVHSKRSVTKTCLHRQDRVMQTFSHNWSRLLQKFYLSYRAMFICSKDIHPPFSLPGSIYACRKNKVKRASFPERYQILREIHEEIQHTNHILMQYLPGGLQALLYISWRNCLAVCTAF